MAPATVAAIQPRLALDARAPEVRAPRLLWRGGSRDPANPLPARVMVNRVWHYHFGRGIVATPSDFGFNGAPPSHPELLDWLASTVHRRRLAAQADPSTDRHSATYRQSSRLDAKAQAIDRDNRLLWRMTPRRLEAESLRDAILATSGRLDTADGRPRLQHLGDEHELRGRVQAARRARPGRLPADGLPVQAAEPARPDLRRLRLPRRGPGRPAPQCLDDGPPGPQPAQQPVRDPASDLFRPAARGRGRRPTRPARPTAGFAWPLADRRRPSERNAAVALIGSHGSAAFCRALYNANEFVYVP